MPVVDGVYQAPTWVNNGPPAIDETEMQAISDTVAQTGNVTTPAQTLGLTGDLSIGASLGVLATAGDLHVWRRMQQVGDKIPATYKLGPQESKSIYVAQPRQVSFSASVSVSDDGTISLVSPENITLTDNGGYISTLESSLRGKYATWDGLNGICFVPSSCSFSYASMFYTCSAVQMLIFVPAVPPGTYTDYPVSVNPNAYQTGSDAKPAGYTLGEVQSGQFVLSPRYYTGKFTFYYVASLDDISVSDDGTVSIPQTDKISVYGFSDKTELLNAIKGKVLQLYGESTVTPPSPFGSGIAFYVPEDATISQYDSLSGVTIDKYQPVTGYPATPAGTTIEYLGKLGDKSRMQIVSYVGTGRYGSGNPCSIDADFPIRLLTFLGQLSTSGSGTWSENAGQYASNNVLPALLTETPQSGAGFSVTSRSTCTTYASKDKKTVNWYNSSASLQLNESGREYYFLCQG